MRLEAVIAAGWKPARRGAPRRGSKRAFFLLYSKAKGGPVMAKDHGKSVKDDKKYEALKREGHSKERAAKIANSGKSGSRKGGKNSGGKN
jgi:hypothetical protein